MFSRIMGMVMAVILLVTMGISSMSYFTLRNQQISARLDALMREAREIAYLAARNSASSVGILFGQNDSTMNYIRW